MSDVILDGINGQRLRLSGATGDSHDGIWSYRAMLELPEGQIETVVWDSGDDLAEYLRGLADAWRGFEGVREFHSLEGQLCLACHHDGKGTVESAVTLRRHRPPSWTLTADLDLGSGAHLDRISRDAERFVRRMS